MDMGLKGKRALVLGASRGLGAAIARGLTEEGVKVFAAARTIENMSPDELIVPLRVDLSDSASVAALAQRIDAEGGIDILVNNSGGPKAGTASGQTPESWRNAFETLAVSIFSITEALVPGMIERKWGRVLTIGSSGVEQPIAGLALSNGARSAVSGWSKTLAAEVARHGVTVNMILPGRIDTDRVRELDAIKARNTGMMTDEVRTSSYRDIPAGRYGKADEFASVAVFLCSERASYVTGSMIRVDGGFIKGL